MRRHVLLKFAGTTLAIALFFIAYFHLLHHPAYAVTTMPVTALDGLIPFQPQALFVYLTLWLYVGVGPGLQPDLLELSRYGLWVCLLCATGLAIFYFWPTQVPPTGIDVSSYAGFSMLQGVDAAGNACPSMHVAIAAFTMLRLEHVWRRLRAPAFLSVLNLTWCVAIVLSTLLTRQHVVLDALAGALLGTAFAWASLRAPRLARRDAARGRGRTIARPTRAVPRAGVKLRARR